jgi:hypothetical protein
MHHWHVTENQTVHERRTLERQATIVNRWVTELAPGGRFVVADVGFPTNVSGEYLQSVATNFDDAWGNAITWGEVTSLDERLTGYDFTGTAEALGIAGALDRLTFAGLARYYDKLGLVVDDKGPTTFFDNFVTQHSPVGHDAYFHTEQSLQTLLKSCGLTNVVSGVLPTPWLFPNIETARTFARDLFGLSDTTTDAEIDTHLEFQHSSNGSVSVRWQLMYAAGIRP